MKSNIGLIWILGVESKENGKRQFLKRYWLRNIQNSEGHTNNQIHNKSSLG